MIDVGNLMSGSQLSPTELLGVLRSQGAKIQRLGPATVGGAVSSKRWCANFLTSASSGTPYCNAMLVKVPMLSIKPPMVEPSLAMVMNNSPGVWSSNRPTTRTCPASRN